MYKTLLSVFKLQEISLLKSEAGQKRFSRLVMCANKGTGVGGVNADVYTLFVKASIN